MKVKSRKQARKEFRKAKKVKKHEFFSKKKLKHNFGPNEGKTFKVQNEEGKTEIKKKEFKNPLEKQAFEREKEKKKEAALEKGIKEQRIKKLKEDNMKEEMEIKKLEKQLKMHKGKSKAFAFDGLDYLLDICDKKFSKNELSKTFEESDSEFESDLENILETPKEKKSKKNVKKKKDKLEHEKEEEDEEDDDDDDDGVSAEEEGEDDDSLSREDEEEPDFDEELNSDLEDPEDADFKVPKRKLTEKTDKRTKKKVKFATEHKLESDTDSDDNNKVPSKSKKKIKKEKMEVLKSEKVQFEEEEEDGEDELGMEEELDFDDEDSLKVPEKSAEVAKMWEDIYGRTRDEKGNIIKTYTPPQLREKIKAESGKYNEKLERLKKQLKGLLNRLAESNMAFISNQIEQLYMSNSRNDMNETLFSLFSNSLFSEVLTPERLITEHAMLIAVLHSNIGSEIGAHFLQHSVTEFTKILEKNPPVEDKTINNILLFIMHLYNFQIFHSKLMYDLVNELLNTLEEKQIELILTTLRTVGFNLRKDDPVALKSLVIKVQEKANAVSTGENSSRVRFMVEMLMAIKNNNMSKIPNYNPEYVEKLRKSLKVLVRKGNYSTELNISLQDLLNAEKHGRWWIVGSAWSGSAPSQPNPDKPAESEALPATKFSQKLLDLAKKQRMNTDVRRNIFCILMSAEDFLEAFEKLLKLKLKGAVEREIMNVLIHCALQEKNFNPYYVYLANKFCTFDRKYQMMLQCAVWDRIKELPNALPVQVTNLAKFVGNVILERGLPISVLKVIQFSDLDKPTIKFMRQVLLSILFGEDKKAVAAAFKRVADSPKLKIFRESLRLFLHHFVLKNTKNVEEEKVARLTEMVKLAEQALESSDVQLAF